jgi:hypothetical protein
MCSISLHNPVASVADHLQTRLSRQRAWYHEPMRRRARHPADRLVIVITVAIQEQVGALGNLLVFTTVLHRHRHCHCRHAFAVLGFSRGTPNYCLPGCACPRTSTTVFCLLLQSLVSNSGSEVLQGPSSHPSNLANYYKVWNSHWQYTTINILCSEIGLLAR